MAQTDVYQKCIDAARNDSDGLFRGVTRQVLETFQAHAESALSNRDRKRYADYLTVLRRVEVDLVRACVQSFDTLVQPSMLGKPAGQTDSAGLQLEDDDTLWEDVEVSQLTLMIESGTEWELRELDSRMESLLRQGAGGNRDATPANPLRPELFARTLHQALKSLDVNLETREALLGAFGVAMADALKAMYGAYNERLEAAGKSLRDDPPGPAAGDTSQQPGLGAIPDPHRGSSIPASPPGSASALKAPAMQSGQATSLRAVLDRLTQASRQDAGGARAPAAAEGAAQAPTLNIIQAHRQELQDATSGLLDRLIIDAVALMFDHALADPRLLPQVRTALGRLQVPVLRLALLDAGVLSSPEHAARRLMNRIASISADYATADEAAASGFLDWLSAQVAIIVHSSRDSEALYAQALDRLREWVAQDRAASPKAADSAHELARRAALRDALGRETLRQLEHRDIDPYLADFMRGPWIAVLVESTLCDGEDGPATRAYRQCGHDLLESVQAKTSDTERKALLEQLPGLVRQLQAGLSMIEWPQPQCASFFSNLMRTHAQAIRGAVGVPSLQPLDDLAQEGAGDLPPPMGHVPAPEVVGTSAHVPAPGDDGADPGHPEALRPPDDPLTSGATPSGLAGPPQLRAKDDPQAFIDALHEGDWVLWNLQGQWTSAQLTWRSPQGLLFMFTSRVGGQAHSLTRRAFERLLKSEQILPMQPPAFIGGAAQDIGTAAHDGSRSMT
ncbi:MAG: DUF1631 family protein [Betaproteobacteria bacterium]|nr:DUF1631 family protein [Betaproteobacteria bacterium]